MKNLWLQTTAAHEHTLTYRARDVEQSLKKAKRVENRRGENIKKKTLSEAKNSINLSQIRLFFLLFALFVALTKRRRLNLSLKLKASNQLIEKMKKKSVITIFLLGSINDKHESVSREKKIN